MEKLIQTNAVLSQLRRIPGIKYPHIKDFIKNDDLMNEIARISSETMEKNIEDFIVSCGGLHFHLLGKKSETNASVWYSKKEIMKICHGESPTMIHFHGPYLGYLSPQDDLTNKEAFFKDGAKMSCASGIDGIHCRTKQWHYIRMPWSDAFYDKIARENNIPTIKNIRSVKCFPKKVGRGKKVIICQIESMNGREIYEGIFNEVGCEYEENYKHLYVNMKDTDKNMHPISNEYHDDGFHCTIFERKVKGKPFKRMLTCFKQKII